MARLFLPILLDPVIPMADWMDWRERHDLAMYCLLTMRRLRYPCFHWSEL